MSVAAVIVTYFPKANLLTRVLMGLASQVDCIYVIDNTPKPVLPNQPRHWLNAAWLEPFGTIHYHALEENLGIAKAQNIAIFFAFAANYQEIIFFDQDSFPPANLVDALLVARAGLENSGARVGAIGPLILDKKSNLFTPYIQASSVWVSGVNHSDNLLKPAPAEYIISSGSLISASTLQLVGLMNERLFIDWVDVEWGLRAQTHGLTNYVTPTVVMDHSIGDSYVKIGPKIIYKHNDLRNFYIVRNACYLVLYGRFKFAWHFTVLMKIPLYIFFYTWTATGSKLRVFKVLLKGALWGVRGKLGPAPANLL